MTHLKIFLIFLFFSSSFLAQAIPCNFIYEIKNDFLDTHIVYSKISSTIKKRTLDQFLKLLDAEKVYFLQSDIRNIKQRSVNIFKKIKRRDCSDLNYIYDIYAQRVSERIDFAQKYLKGFSEKDFNKNFTYIVDEKLKRYPTSKRKANQMMKVNLQYYLAGTFIAEGDIQKAIQHVSILFQNKKKRVLSWKPVLSASEHAACLKKSRGSFKACKPNKWRSLYLNAFAKSLDSHSSYLDQEDYREFQVSINLELPGGIGAILGSQFGFTTIEKVLPGSPAERTKKLKKKDKILAVGNSKSKLIEIFGESIGNVVSIIRGKRGSPVYLKILREEKDKSTTFVVRIVRDRVDIKSQEASILYVDKKINQEKYKVALLKVPSFYGSQGAKSVTKDVLKLIEQAKKNKVDTMVLDLSNNSGGILDEAVDLAGLFFAEGNVVKQSSRRGGDSPILRDEEQSTPFAKPLVVLVNRFSASASEIVSGTLQDYKRAVIVGGDHTFGKGSVQNILPIKRGRWGAIKTTMGLYFTPSGKSTQKRGVVSDISLPNIFSTERVGENVYEFPLPEQKIRDFKSPQQEILSENEEERWQPITSRIINVLKKYSRSRVQKNDKFKEIIEDLAKIKKKIKEQKSVTIGEILDKERDEDEDEDEDITDDMKKKKKYLARADIQESANIAAHLVSILKNKKVSQNQPKQQK